MPYRLKHKPTGLYFQPHKHRGSHFSKNGKIYHTEMNARRAIGLGMLGGRPTDTFVIHVADNSVVHKMTIDKLSYAPVSHAYKHSYQHH